MRHLKTRYLIADGQGARWVAWNADHRAFVTEGHVQADAARAPRGPRPVFPSHAGGPHGASDAKTIQLARERFAETLAQLVNAEVAAGRLERLGLVGSPRLLHALKQRLSHAALGRLVQDIPKNLAGVPDADLAAWLS